MRYIITIVALLLCGCVKEPSYEMIDKPEPISSELPNAHVLTLKPNKEIVMNESTYDFEMISQAFEETKEKKEAVVLKAYADTTAGDIVLLIDRIKELGYEKIYISTIKE